MRGSQKNKDYKVRWNPKFAYAIGLLTTDGNLSKDGRHINFTSKDYKFVKTFCECMDLSNIKISKKVNGSNGNKHSWVQFSNVRLYKYLLKIGLMPNKSRKIDKLKIPEKYFFDFLRGHFDGDGSCSSYWDERWRNSFMFYTKFTSASKKHISWIRFKLKKLLNIKGSLSCISKPPRRPFYCLRYAKKESKNLFLKMYYKKELPRLHYKYEKLSKALKIDKKIKESI